MSRLLLVLSLLGVIVVTLVRFAKTGRVPGTIGRPLRTARRIGQRLLRAFIAMLLAAIAVLMVSIAVGPIGIDGMLLGLLVIMLTPIAVLLWPRRRARPVANPQGMELAALPRAVLDYVDEHWGELPYAAYPKLDHIRETLGAITPQLSALDPLDPATHSLRQLIGVHLPAVVDNYLRVPHRLRGSTKLSSGKTVDGQLLDSLTLLSNELDEAALRIAQGNLSAVDVQGRFLEARFRQGLDQ